ncbi:Receptor-like protein kinase [Quillaja saponaria]|uniref:Receptor-like protein kinase n=1 Tax=Quillaja saponaria TaxID=32244 RepID=A0AAD7PIJ3_QUISA|nr:Receptor-like protein kinase [Quillaja saponaria]
MIMGGETKWVLKSQPFSSSISLILIALLLSSFANLVVSKDTNSSSTEKFSPPANFLIDCGSKQQSRLDDGRIFKSDRESSSLLATSEDVQVSVDTISNSTIVPPSLSPSSLPLFRSARVFLEESTYTFYIPKSGRIWVRLYFFPLPRQSYNLTDAVFCVHTDQIVLLHDFSVSNNTAFVFKEYLVNVAGNRFSLKFKPKKKSSAFVNAIEVVSAPDPLISDAATSVSPAGEYTGLSSSALQVYYRVNVGGPGINPDNDTLSRTWESDKKYNAFPDGSQNVSVTPNSIKFPDGGATAVIAPNWIYSTAEQMKDPLTMEPNFNLSWVLNVEESYSYLIRLHFCDIVSKSLNELYFNVYINGMIGVSSLDLSTQTKGLATAFYKDFVLNASAITNSSIMVQVGPANLQQGTKNAILNGLEVMKMSNIANSLDGFVNVEGKPIRPSERAKVMKIIAAIGLAMAVTAMLLLATVCIRWQKRPEGWENRKSFSSWLLPLHANHSSFLSSKSSSRKSSVFGSRKSKSGYSSLYSSAGLGRFFTFNELQNATNFFDEKAIIGVGGFGKVYIGTLEDGTKVAIKRGNPGSEQGINEFRTEIDMLSKLRHRHLVSLMGFCDEQSEMILVYEYMANGPLRDHLYGSNLASLSWKQRLEICIGSARGLHYLHTGAAQSIIHRDVKTTNILLDENFVAKVSDFGLSKAVPENTHVSTAVKGSFGYLDPEYFRSQQLTEKSDVYSFGVVLIEVLCARTVISPTLPREQVNLAEWAMQNHRKGTLGKIIDPRIASSINPGSLKKIVEAAEKCLADHGGDRPGMGDVLWNLEYALQLQEAASQIDHPEDKSTNFIPLDHPNEDDHKIGDSSVTYSSDKSEVTDLFSQIAKLQGR